MASIYIHNVSGQNLVIRDLAGCRLAAGQVFEISRTRSIEEINSSQDLKNYIDNGDITISYDGVTQLTKDESLSQASGFASFFKSVENITPLMNQARDNYQTYLTLSFEAPEQGDYVIDWSIRWSLNDTGQDFLLRFEVDGEVDDKQQFRIEPSDSGGTGETVNVIGGGTANTGTNQKYPLADHFTLKDLPAGSHSIKLQFGASSSNREATIYNAELSVTRKK